MTGPGSAAGQRLWGLLPNHHRIRDAETGGDLAALLDAAGTVLDDLRGTLDQRLAEITPQARHPVLPRGEDPVREPQEWLLPYLADLLAVRLVAPDDEGRRTEIAHAIDWRQGAGTLAVAQQAAAAVAHAVAVLAEGRDLVVATPRVDLALRPERAFTDAPALPAPAEQRRQPHVAARHPGLPAGTPAVGSTSRAVQAGPAHPLARRREDPAGGADVVWRHLDPRGVPCFPGTHEDTLPRTPDARDPDARRGRHHPARVVVHVAPPAGFFPVVPPPGPLEPALVLGPAPDRHEISDRLLSEVEISGSTAWVRRCRIEGPVTITAPGVHRFDGVIMPTGSVTLGPGVRLDLVGCAVPDVVCEAGPGPGAGATDPTLPGPLDGTDVLVAMDSLLRSVRAPGGRVTLDGVTVLGPCEAHALRASETVFASEIDVADPAGSGLRWSAARPPAGVATHAVTARRPLFSPGVDCASWDVVASAAWGTPGCGVLAPDGPDAVGAGAEDGGEIGAYHHRRYAAVRAAVADKLGDLLPVGVEPVVTEDRRLWARPPAAPIPPGGHP